MRRSLDDVRRSFMDENSFKPSRNDLFDQSMPLDQAFAQIPAYTQHPPEPPYIGSESAHLGYEDVKGRWFDNADSAMRDYDKVGHGLAMAMRAGEARSLNRVNRNVARNDREIEVERQMTIDGMDGDRSIPIVFTPETPGLDEISDEDQMELMVEHTADRLYNGKPSATVYIQLYKQLKDAVTQRRAMVRKRAGSRQLATAMRTYDQAYRAFQDNPNSQTEEEMRKAERDLAASTGKGQLSIFESFSRPVDESRPFNRINLNFAAKSGGARDKQRVRDHNYVQRQLKTMVAKDKRGRYYVPDEKQGEIEGALTILKQHPKNK